MNFYPQFPFKSFRVQHAARLAFALRSLRWGGPLVGRWRRKLAADGHGRLVGRGVAVVLVESFLELLTALGGRYRFFFFNTVSDWPTWRWRQLDT